MFQAAASCAPHPPCRSRRPRVNFEPSKLRDRVAPSYNGRPSQAPESPAGGRKLFGYLLVLARPARFARLRTSARHGIQVSVAHGSARLAAEFPTEVQAAFTRASASDALVPAWVAVTRDRNARSSAANSLPVAAFSRSGVTWRRIPSAGGARSLRKRLSAYRPAISGV